VSDFLIMDIEDKEEFLKYRTFLTSTPLAPGLTQHQLLARCLDGTFKGWKLVEKLDEGSFITRGLIVYHINQQAKAMTLVIINCDGYVLRFRNMVVEKARSLGMKKLLGVSVHTDPKIMQNVFRGLDVTSYLYYEVKI
jgi:hypothetical protein